MTVPMYVLPFINSCKQMFSQQVAMLVEAITACRCLAQPSSQRLPLLEICWQSDLLQAKVIWISSHHLDQLPAASAPGQIRECSHHPLGW